MSRILSTGGGVSASGSRGCLPLGPGVYTPLRQTSPPPDGHCSGRYASHWNAFLLHFKFQNNLEEVFSFAMDMLSEEAQPSVRLVVEWISVLLLLRNPHLRRHLWENLKRGSDKKAACLCSLHSIVMHLSKLITDPLEKVGELYMCR